MDSARGPGSARAPVDEAPSQVGERALVGEEPLQVEEQALVGEEALSAGEAAQGAAEALPAGERAREDAAPQRAHRTSPRAAVGLALREAASGPRAETARAGVAPAVQARQGEMGAEMGVLAPAGLQAGAVQACCRSQAPAPFLQDRLQGAPGQAQVRRQAEQARAWVRAPVAWADFLAPERVPRRPDRREVA